ncbi:MAG TPA: tRNA (adenosine(37)-N6)-threonylcarbamoyltransferase complex dimerization subunit type 1 TsaB [Cyclobacteriaceae bacterium]|nr:tRNA (adenosine(37)-N6)-threonylcarbamoyltransferase complex dimerization subunit type 1 TsaB [Cyclobacteriaceae bacterium]
MTYILSLETSTNVCSVALHADGKLKYTAEVHEDQAHAAKLAVLIDQLFHASGIEPNQVSGVAVSAGPGSYTGLRIGTATAKGLCYALNVPLIAVGTLELMSFQVQRFNFSGGVLCPMIDARRMEVYCMLMDAGGQTLAGPHPRIIDSASFANELEVGQLVFFGNGAAKCREVIVHRNAVFVEGIYPTASALGELAHAQFLGGRFADLSTFGPLYLKEFVAKKARTLV